jgi:uncharacterized membrane protein YkvA (DUF1232 family)
MPVLARVKSWADDLRRDVVALFLAARDARTPWYAKVAAGVVAAYALSPIDLIPDFIPIIGYLDDLVLVPLGIWMVVRLIPDELMGEFRAEAARINTRPRSLAGAAVVIIAWVFAAAMLTWWLWPKPPV